MVDVITDITVHVDGRDVAAKPGELLIEVCERAGTFVPRFCYHRRLDPVGICRMCLVEVETPRGATLQPACFITVTDGLVARTATDKVKKAQDGIIEFLLVNHPLDCPVCDKGGECPLQDQTLAHGSGDTRFVEEKRHFAKPLPIGEFVLLDRERCIQCARCTRFADEIAGEATIDFAGRGDRIEVAPFPTEPFDSIFSGNTVQICPVGALTARPYRFTARPWDLEQVESTCATCAVGCRVAVQSSGDRLTRVLGVDAEGVNQGWLCDKGRFAIGAVEARAAGGDPLDPTMRLSEPLVRKNGRLVPVTWSEALAAAADVLRDGGDTVGAIGGAALTNEGAFAWRTLFSEVLHSPHLDAQYGDGIDAALLDALPRATISDATSATTVLTLCGDLREELPVLFLRLRRALTKGTTRLVEVAATPTALTSLAAVSLAVRPGDAASIARALAGDDSAVASLSTNPHGATFTASELARARDVIGDGSGVVVVVGRPNVAESSAIVEAAIRTFAATYPGARFLFALRRANVFGALTMGVTPMASGQRGRSAIEQLRAVSEGTQRALLVLGGALTGNVADRQLAATALTKARVVAVSGHGSADWSHAEVVLPASVTHERSGTVTNLEGRVTDVQAKVSSPGASWDDVAIASELAVALGGSLGFGTPGDAGRAIEATLQYPAASVAVARHPEGVLPGSGAPRSGHAMDPISFPGVLKSDFVRDEAADAPREWAAPPRTSAVGETRVPVPIADAYSLLVVAARRLYDGGAAVTATEALAGLNEPFVLRAHPHDLDRIGAKTGDVVRVVTPRGTFESPVAADDAVVRGTAVVPLNARDDEGAASLLFDASALVTEIRLDSR